MTDQVVHGVHEYDDDPRNDAVLVHVNGDPGMTVGPATIVIVPEHKQPGQAVLDSGIRMFTVHVRRPYPDVLDPKLNTHSKLNDITACIQAYSAGADEALMLDPHGFGATCNSTHFFVVRRGELWTSSGAFCLGGITRGRRCCGWRATPASRPMSATSA